LLNKDQILKDFKTKNNNVKSSDIADLLNRGNTAAAGGIASTALSGQGGPAQVLAQFTNQMVETIIPGLGAVAGQVISILAQGPEAAKAFILGIVENIPVIVQNIILAIPEVIQALADKIPQVAADFISSLIQNLPRLIGAAVTSLSSQMPVVATNFTIELVKNIPEIVKGFVNAFKDQFGNIGKTLGIGGGGGGIIGGIGDVFGGIGDAVRDQDVGRVRDERRKGRSRCLFVEVVVGVDLGSIREDLKEFRCQRGGP
jgi:hypothetical protein